MCRQLQTIRWHDDDNEDFGDGGGDYVDDDDNGDNNNNNNNRNVKSKLIPLIIVATGIISTSVRTNLSNITGNHEIKKLQKIKNNGQGTRTSVSTTVK
jgi:hypothetical protein